MSCYNSLVSEQLMLRRPRAFEYNRCNVVCLDRKRGIMEIFVLSMLGH